MTTDNNKVEANGKTIEQIVRENLARVQQRKRKDDVFDVGHALTNFLFHQNGTDPSGIEEAVLLINAALKAEGGIFFKHPVFKINKNNKGHVDTIACSVNIHDDKEMSVLIQTIQRIGIELLFNKKNNTINPWLQEAIQGVYNKKAVTESDAKTILGQFMYVFLQMLLNKHPDNLKLDKKARFMQILYAWRSCIGADNDEVNTLARRTNTKIIDLRSNPPDPIPYLQASCFTPKAAQAKMLQLAHLLRGYHGDDTFLAAIKQAVDAGIKTEANPESFYNSLAHQWIAIKFLWEVQLTEEEPVARSIGDLCHAIHEIIAPEQPFTILIQPPFYQRMFSGWFKKELVSQSAQTETISVAMEGTQTEERPTSSASSSGSKGVELNKTGSEKTSLEKTPDLLRLLGEIPEKVMGSQTKLEIVAGLVSAKTDSVVALWQEKLRQVMSSSHGKVGASTVAALKNIHELLGCDPKNFPEEIETQRRLAALLLRSVCCGGGKRSVESKPAGPSDKLSSDQSLRTPNFA